MCGSRSVAVVGRLMDDPKLRRSRTGGAPFLELKLAITRRGEQEDETATVDACVRGRLAEICAGWLKKGGLLEVGGSLKAHRSKGASRARLEVVADRVEILEPAR